MSNQVLKFFGTDGIRGKVGDFPITADFIVKLGWAVGTATLEQGGSKVVIGKDTRISGYMIESALEAGLAAAGVESYLLGPMPTPAIAHITSAFQADLGIVISASHNPFDDNGVKFFTQEGFKISRELEARIEHLCGEPMMTLPASKLGRARRVNDASGRYVEFCKSSLPHRTSFRGLKIVIDCANGAAYKVAPMVLSELGAEVVAIHVAPNGLNINKDCGSTHPASLQAAVIAEKADVGIALDGDADRVVMVDAAGSILDGDELLYIIAKGLMGTPYFSGGVVGTVMSNQGLDAALTELGLEFVRVNVGDQYILQELIKRNWLLGGEPSGHITYLHVNTTADGIIGALQVLQYIHANQVSLEEARQGIKIFPQKVTSLYIKGPKVSLEEGKMAQVIAKAKSLLGEKGRVLVRYSGTEPVIRVMVECENSMLLDQVNDLICQAIRESMPCV